jgi:hypothetical protein
MKTEQVKIAVYFAICVFMERSERKGVAARKPFDVLLAMIITNSFLVRDAV